MTGHAGSTEVKTTEDSSVEEQPVQTGESSAPEMSEETLEDTVVHVQDCAEYLLMAVNSAVVAAYKLRQENEALVAENSTLKANLQATRKQVRDLKSQLRGVQKENQNLRTENQELGQEVTALQGSIEGLSGQVKADKRRRFHLTRRISQLLDGDLGSDSPLKKKNDSTGTRLRIALVSGRDFSDQNQRNLSTLREEFPDMDWELIEVPCDKRGLHDFDLIAYHTGLVRNHKYGFWVTEEARKAGVIVIKGRTPQKIVLALQQLGEAGSSQDNDG